MKKCFLPALLALLFTACQKNGDLVAQPEFFEIRLTWLYTPDTDVAYTVEFEGNRVTDSLVFNIDQKFARKMLPGASMGKKRIVLKVTGTDSTVLDTSVMVNGMASFQLLAVSATDKPVLVGGNSEGGETPDPSSRTHGKHRYYYTDPLLPDSVRMEIHVCNAGVRPFTYQEAPSGVLNLKKGAFSPYIELPMDVYGRNTLYLFKLINPKDGSMIQDITFRHATRIDQAAGYSDSFRSNRASADGVPPYKFVTSILRYGGPDEVPARQDKFHDLTLFMTNW
ncbi:hypothetical protein [Chitinophaga deserti]|uniref:hypothetical protein n=1 Tax=Chitinophaga deserti TaxID=2164099 RepID=UPI000D6D5126|nr:hypothetical protein [Chitinophaga deserti]